eukprot:TRINITY_DN54612_c0_g1_i1.p1 TRINITY_DN54612_c0_g1~~TRINITY_DN54612_c0_g1_i1.p1  ORF type:complete len:162 (+),score=0.93 TRINITY_DN54612_c0_g1_i1:47-487(+)
MEFTYDLLASGFVALMFVFGGYTKLINHPHNAPLMEDPYWYPRWFLLAAGIYELSVAVALFVVPTVGSFAGAVLMGGTVNTFLIRSTQYSWAMRVAGLAPTTAVVCADMLAQYLRGELQANLAAYGGCLVVGFFIGFLVPKSKQKL